MKKRIKEVLKIITKTRGHINCFFLNTFYNLSKKNSIRIQDNFRASRLKIKGEDNIVALNINCKGVRIIINGRGNHIELSGDFLKNTKIEINGDNCSLILNQIEHVYNTSILQKGNKNTFIMGERASINGCRSFQIGEGNNITIGKGCMLSDGIEVWPSDTHNIYDMTTHERLNQERDIVLEDHVWVGHGVSLLKGIRVGTGAMIGTKAIITKDVPPNSVVVTEYRQRIVRGNIYWKA